MIALLQGEIDEITPTYVVLNVNGVGYQVSIPLTTFSKIEKLKSVKLFTHLSIREDAHILYGFSDKSERHLFKLLISVTGVGGNTALMMLSSMGPDEIQKAIATNDVLALKAIKGIGEKTAKQIILDLKDKISKEVSFDVISSSIIHPIKNEALSALVALGFNKNATEKMLDKILKESNESVTVEQLIKVALKTL